MFLGQWKSYLEMMDLEIQLGAKTHYERRSRRSILYASLAQSSKDSLDAGFESANRCEAMLRCLRIMNAIHLHPEFKAEPKMASLQIPDQAMVDPYNGRPLSIRSTPSGWVVYSVGPDETDSGGRLSDFQDIGMGPPP